MPIYEYRCESCGHEFESLRKLSDAPLTTCPACAAEALVKKVSAAGFQLKGSGWYVTDFRNGSKPAETKKPATAGDSAKPGDAKPADAAKPAATTAEAAPAAPSTTAPASTATPSSGSSGSST